MMQTGRLIYLGSLVRQFIIHVFSRLVAEVDEVLGDKHEIEFDDLGRLTYMGQVQPFVFLFLNNPTAGKNSKSDHLKNHH